MFAREQPPKEFVASFLFMQAYHTSTRAYSSPEFDCNKHHHQHIFFFLTRRNSTLLLP